LSHSISPKSMFLSKDILILPFSASLIWELTFLPTTIYAGPNFHHW
jgi:hypothetical protein